MKNKPNPIDLSTEEKQIAFLKNPNATLFGHGNIREIKNPSEKVQMVALRQTPMAIYHIEHPTPKALKYAQRGFQQMIEQFCQYDRKLQNSIVYHSLNWYGCDDVFQHPGIPGNYSRAAMKLIKAKEKLANKQISK